MIATRSLVILFLSIDVAELFSSLRSKSFLFKIKKVEQKENER